MLCAASVKSNRPLWNDHPDKSALCSIFTTLPRLRTMSFTVFQLQKGKNGWGLFGLGYNNGRIWWMSFQYYPECYSGREGAYIQRNAFSGPPSRAASLRIRRQFNCKVSTECSGGEGGGQRLGGDQYLDLAIGPCHPRIM
jgi:hypothetical protein